MKTARANCIAVFEFSCPHCQECIESPTSGSLMWLYEDIIFCKKLLVCHQCVATSRIPAAIVRAAEQSGGAKR